MKKVNFRNLFPHWQNLDPKKKVLAACLGILILSAAFQVLGRHGESKAPKTREFQSFDEMLNEGQSLVPIEVNNIEALDGVLGSQGVVDIYAINPVSNRQLRIARYVKVVRSRENYLQLSVLVDDDASDTILQYPGPYTLVVQQQAASAKKMKRSRKKEKVQVSYER